MSAKNPAAVALGRIGGRARSAAKTTSSRENGRKGGRPRRSVIQTEYQDSDGYWIELAPGWKNGSDPIGCEHGIVEDTKSAAYKSLASVMPCDCTECRELLDAAKK